MPLFSPEFYADLGVDACFLIDIALCFRTAVLADDKADETAREQKLMTDYRYIAKKYLKGWFLIDVASSVPLDTILSLAIHVSALSNATPSPSPPAPFDIEFVLYRTDPRCGSQEDSGTNFLKLIRLIRLLKLARFLKLGRMIKRLEDQLDLNPAVLRFTILVVKIVFLCHLIACAWMFMHTLAADRCVGAAWGCRGLHGVAWGCSRGGRGCSWVRRVAAGRRGVAAKARCCVYAHARRCQIVTWLSPLHQAERGRLRAHVARELRAVLRGHAQLDAGGG